MDAARFRPCFFESFPLEEGEFLARFSAGDEWARLGAADHQALSAWSDYQSLQEAAASSGRPLTELRAWAKQGRLWREADLPRTCARPDSGSPVSICAIGMTTRDRRDAVRRAVLSFGNNALDAGRMPEMILIDDSADPLEQARNQAVMDGLAREIALPLRYSGRPEREAFAVELAGLAEVPLDVAQFALFGDQDCSNTTGAARNSLQLDCAGAAYLLIDDDSACRPSSAPDRKPGLALTSETNPSRLWFFKDREEELAAVPVEEEDHLGAHEELLGRDIGSLAAEAESLTLDALTAETEANLRRDGGRVRATMGSFYGDSGFESTAFLWLDRASIERLTASEETWSAAVENRRLFRAVPRKTIAPGRLCIGADLAVDARTTPPPFIPVQRNSDRMFTVTLRAAYPTAYTGYLPTAFHHDPLEARKSKVETYWSMQRSPRLPDIIAYWLYSAPVPPAGLSGDERLVRLGEWMREAASLPQHEFDVRIRRRALEKYASGLRADPSHGDDGLPEFYARLRRKLRAEAAKGIETGECAVPRDLPGESPAARQAKGRELTGKVAALFEAWPALFAAAVELRRRERRLSRPVSKRARTMV